MQITFIHTYTCSCGGISHGCLVATVRINKNSIVQSSGLGVMPPTCRACQREFQADAPVRITIAPEDMGKVNAYRQRRGWDAIPDAALGARMLAKGADRAPEPGGTP